jgi:hypothetical protein
MKWNKKKTMTQTEGWDKENPGVFWIAGHPFGTMLVKKGLGEWDVVYPVLTDAQVLGKEEPKVEIHPEPVVKLVEEVSSPRKLRARHKKRTELPKSGTKPKVKKTNSKKRVPEKLLRPSPPLGKGRDEVILTPEKIKRRKQKCSKSATK